MTKNCTIETQLDKVAQLVTCSENIKIPVELEKWGYNVLVRIIQLVGIALDQTIEGNYFLEIDPEPTNSSQFKLVLKAVSTPKPLETRVAWLQQVRLEFYPHAFASLPYPDIQSPFAIKLLLAPTDTLHDDDCEHAALPLNTSRLRLGSKPLYFQPSLTEGEENLVVSDIFTRSIAEAMQLIKELGSVVRPEEALALTVGALEILQDGLEGLKKERTKGLVIN